MSIDQILVNMVQEGGPVVSLFPKFWDKQILATMHGKFYKQDPYYKEEQQHKLYMHVAKYGGTSMLLLISQISASVTWNFRKIIQNAYYKE